MQMLHCKLRTRYRTVVDFTDWLVSSENGTPQQRARWVPQPVWSLELRKIFSPH
jgi:hypothetical protein